MRSLFSLGGALAGMMAAASVFAQTPYAMPHQPSSFQPGPHQTYFAEPNHHAAELWQPRMTPVNYARQAEPPVPPVDAQYIDDLNANPYREQLDAGAAPGQLHSPYAHSPYGTGLTDCGMPMAACDSTAIYGCAPCGPQWFGYAGGLIMTKSREREIWMSYDSGDFGRAVMGTHDASMGWDGGYELRLGRHLGCRNWAVEGVFWTIRGDSEFSATCDDVVGGLRTPLEVNFQGLTYGHAPNNFGNVEDFFGNAEIHRLRRSFDFYNVEVNLFQDPNLYTNFTDCGGFHVGMVGGLRYFRFSDRMLFSANTEEKAFVGGLDEIHYGVDANNNLMGAQIGFLGNYSHGRWNLYGGSKMGLFGNHITHRSRMHGAQGNAYIANPLSPNDGREFDVNATRNVVSFLGELDMGASYQLTRCFSVRGGYRAIAITDVALSTDQIPQNFEDLGVIGATQASSSVILHGAYIGGEFVW